jgi:hypothetical protein
MATVPTAQPQETLRPLRPQYVQSNLNADDFGAAKGRGIAKAGAALSNAGDVLGDIVLREQIEDNERGAKDLEVKYRARVNTILYGDGTEKNPGYQALQGEGAVRGQVAAQEAIAKAREELLKEAGNDRVREMFGTTSTILQGDYSNGINRHASAQREVANDAAAQARINSAVDTAALGFSDPEIVASSEVIVRNEVLDIAERKGWSEAVTVDELRKAQTSLYAGMIQSALTEDPDMALDMFTKYKPRMDAKSAAVLGRQVQEVTIAKVAQSVVDEEMAKGGSRADIRARIRDRTSGKGEEEAIQNVNQRLSEIDSDFNRAEAFKNAAYREEQRSFAAQDRAEKEFKENTNKKALVAVREGQTVDQVIAGMTPQELEMVQGQPYFMDNLNKIEQARIKGEMFAPASDGRTLASIKGMSDTERAAVDLTQIQPLMTEAENATAATIVGTAQRKVKDIQDSPKPYDEANRVLNRFAPPALQWGANKQTEKNFQIQRAVEDQMAEFIQKYTSKGEIPPADEVQKEAQRLLMPIYKDGWGSSRPIIGTLATVDKLTADEIADLDIPEANLNSFKALATELGIKKLTDSQRGLMYIATLNKDRNAVAKILGKTVAELDAAANAIKSRSK